MAVPLLGLSSEILVFALESRLGSGRKEEILHERNDGISKISISLILLPFLEQSEQVLVYSTKYF